MKKPSAFNQVLGPGPPIHRPCLIGPLLDICGLGSSPDRLVPLAVRSPDKFTGPQILWIRAFLILFVSVPKIINLAEPNRTPVKLKFICADLSPGRFSCRTRTSTCSLVPRPCKYFEIREGGAAGKREVTVRPCGVIAVLKCHCAVEVEMPVRFSAFFDLHANTNAWHWGEGGWGRGGPAICCLGLVVLI